MITQEELKSILNYNKETGIFTWIKTNSKKIKLNSIAGHIHYTGYVNISINNKKYRAHRLAWLYVYGNIPNVIDHINGNPTDNRICNLRECSQQQNNYNKKISKKNTSGIKGIFWVERDQKWLVQLGVNGKRKHIGYFDDIELAELVVAEARKKYHGEFARD